MGKKPAKKREPTPPWKVVVLLVGLGAIVLGFFAFKYGLGPAGPIADVMMAGQNANQQQLDQMEPAIAELQSTSHVVADVIGLVLSLGGFVMVKVGMSPAKPKSVEQLVQEEVARRLGGTGATSIPVNIVSAASVPPVPAAPAILATPAGPVQSNPVTLDPGTRRTSSTHCATCGRPLLAGKYCRVCDLR